MTTPSRATDEIHPARRNNASRKRIEEWHGTARKVPVALRVQRKDEEIIELHHALG